MVRVENFEVKETSQSRQTRALDENGKVVYTIRTPLNVRDQYNPEHPDNMVEFGDGVQLEDIE